MMVGVVGGYVLWRMMVGNDSFFKGEVMEVIAPSPYVYEVVQTEPNVKGNTAQGYTKPAVLDCGATVTVPGFVEQGSRIKVDTGKGEYMERV